jgi:hypothetical protein
MSTGIAPQFPFCTSVSLPQGTRYRSHVSISFFFWLDEQGLFLNMRKVATVVVFKFWLSCEDIPLVVRRGLVYLLGLKCNYTNVNDVTGRRLSCLRDSLFDCPNLFGTFECQ